MSIQHDEILYLVIPCYNEEAVIVETGTRLITKMNHLISNNKISQKSKIVFVNDGSKDSTWSNIKEFHQKNELVLGINLSRNRGHQNAILAGLMISKEFADMVITLDADLQDDIHAIDNMLEKFYEGNDIVYGVRNTRKVDTYFKRTTAQGFYKVMKWMGADIIYNHADYRLMSKRAINALEDFPEVNLFLRGIVPLIGFPSDKVYYDRLERYAGETKYPLKNMLSFAFNGVTSFSIKPIRLITVLGLVIFCFSIVMLGYSLYSHFIGNTVMGWSSIIISIWAIGGLQLLSIGVIGEYIGKIYMESKHRPKYIIEEFLK